MAKIRRGAGPSGSSSRLSRSLTATRPISSVGLLDDVDRQAQDIGPLWLIDARQRNVPALTEVSEVPDRGL